MQWCFVRFALVELLVEVANLNFTADVLIVLHLNLHRVILKSRYGSGKWDFINQQP